MCAAYHAALAADTPHFLAEEVIQTQTGSLSLEWDWDEAPAAVEFEVQRADDEQFATDLNTLYTGPDKGTYLSGMLEGEYYFRVRALVEGVATDWSVPVLVVVEFPPWKQVLLMFSLGILVLLATLSVVVAGYRITQKGIQ